MSLPPIQVSYDCQLKSEALQLGGKPRTESSSLQISSLGMDMEEEKWQLPPRLWRLASRRQKQRAAFKDSVKHIQVSTIKHPWKARAAVKKLVLPEGGTKDAKKHGCSNYRCILTNTCIWARKKTTAFQSSLNSEINNFLTLRNYFLFLSFHLWGCPSIQSVTFFQCQGDPLRVWLNHGSPLSLIWPLS